ncbi:hypothetical protein [Bombiscardovia coagulans]|uniref:Uncharacterized protein n=1 Tax=Bombiscardovia coagulans TaxID=686666 RepID=A0A261ESZ9_9BIFI|nr:hypothetical protein [Bombiscardovia coagulans]OZG49973.1 hypothetical protein BOCO_0490 [Bombiscardovia coagulans]
MFKRVFWIGTGIVVGVVAVSKAQAYVRANTPQKAREFILGPDEDNVGQRTLFGLLTQFQQVMKTREDELNNQYTERFEARQRSL